MIIDVYTKWAGPCETIKGIFKRIKAANQDIVEFSEAESDSLECISMFKNKSMPLFLIYFQGVLVNIVYGANGPLLEKITKDCSDAIRSNSSIPPYTGEDSPKLVVKKDVPEKILEKAVFDLPPPPQGQEYTFAMIKPDGLINSTEIINKIELNRFSIVKQKKTVFTKEMATQFYKEHQTKSFFKELISFITRLYMY
jgi:hypothetical protein